MARMVSIFGLNFSIIFACLFSLARALYFNSTALVLGVDDVTTNQGYYLLDGYGIAYEAMVLPPTGATLPPLETGGNGNYGLFIFGAGLIINGKSYLTTDQWNAVYAYQIKYRVRMVQIDVIPSPDTGTMMLGSCCDTTTDQNITLVMDVQTEEFPNAGLKYTNMSTTSLYHYPAVIQSDNASTTTAFLNFQPNAQFPNITVAGVINKYPNGREQIATFLSAGNWSETSTYINHACIQWGYRGLYQGFRRIHLGTQVDDLFLQTALYSTNAIFRLRDTDMREHVAWTYDINSRLPNGSVYFSEFGFNANGNLIFNYAASKNETAFECTSPVFTSWEENTQLEYQKPLGTGQDLWPRNPTFGWTSQCMFLDPLAVFFSNITNRDACGLVSHTFTHLELNNATYHDTLREIEFNLMYAELMNFTNGHRFSGGGLIPPAITGLHNGDALRAWTDNGLWNAIGDNTRPSLRNTGHLHWPLITSMANNGFDGYQITPRFATRIYYNCDEVPCDVQQWIDTEGGVVGGSIHTLLDFERATVSNQLITLFHDPYMFHQPNLRVVDVVPEVINGKLQQLSLIQMWVETVTNELMRIVTWPIITLKHDHIAQTFNNRMILDGCKPIIQINLSTNSSVMGFSVVAGTNNACEMPIPVTIPGNVVDTQGARVEQVGTDPMTLWVKLDGAPMSFLLTNAIIL